jgi:hypothetical protein
MCQAVNIMKTLNVIGVIVAVTIIALAGIAIAAAAASLLVQSASATTDLMTTTISVGGGEEGVSTTTTNNTSNATLGSLFLTEEAEFTSFNPINETYIELSFVGNATIMPPNDTNTINATETGNITLNIQPNGVRFAQGQGFLVTEEGDNGAQEEENATTTFVELTRVKPDGTGSGTGVVFFSTNSTGQLAFLDNMVAIFQHEMSPEGDTIREWEWKGGTLPLETGGAGARSMGEQEAASSTTTTTNNVSNAVLGDVFMIVEFETASVNPINETYIETSTLNNVTLMPPNTTTGTTISATETANVTVNILPNGLALDKGQSLIVTQRDDGGAEQENATTTFVDISRLNPDGSGSGTGVVFFSTNSTGQLGFLDNMVGINDSEFSPGSGSIRVWEWKGGTLPIESGAPPTTGNQTTITSALE